MVGPDVGDRHRAVARAFKEIRHVAVNSSALEELGEQRLRDGVLVKRIDCSTGEVEPVAGDEDPAGGTFEGYSILGVVADLDFQTAREGRLDDELSHCVVTVGDRWI